MIHDTDVLYILYHPICKLVQICNNIIWDWYTYRSLIQSSEIKDEFLKSKDVVDDLATRTQLHCMKQFGKTSFYTDYIQLLFKNDLQGICLQLNK